MAEARRACRRSSGWATRPLSRRRSTVAIAEQAEEVRPQCRVTSGPAPVCDAALMDIITLSDAPGYDSDRVVAQPFLEGSQSNVRLIRLSPGQALPPHTHGSSDLMIFAVEGEGTLDTDDGTVRFGAGSLAFYRGDEELRVANKGQTGLTLLAFLSPPFPPRSKT